MAQRKTNQQGILASLDWVTIAIYLVLLVFGWISVCGASYNYGDEDIFSMSTRSGMQIMWIGTSICLGFVILMTDDRLYDTFSYVIYGLMMLLLFATIFNPTITNTASRICKVRHGISNLQTDVHIRL